MFDNLVSNGSILAVVLMIYAFGVMSRVAFVYSNDRVGHMTPGIVRSGFGRLVMAGAIPTFFWPTLYVGLFEGGFLGALTFVATFFGGPALVYLLGIAIGGGALMGLHFIAATAAYVAGYWLSLTNLP